MAKANPASTPRSLVQTLTDRADKKGSIRFNADKGAADPALTSIYVGKVAMLGADIKLDKLKGFKVTLEPIY